jgi:hypothetical protein
VFDELQAPPVAPLVYKLAAPIHKVSLPVIVLADGVTVTFTVWVVVAEPQALTIE